MHKTTAQNYFLIISILVLLSSCSPVEKYKKDFTKKNLTIEKTQDNMDIIDKMFLKWNTKWPKYMSFDQNVYKYKNNEIISQSIWNEIISSPAKLQIRFDGFESGNGVIFFRRSSTFF